jgi:hypothetical protein
MDGGWLNMKIRAGFVTNSSSTAYYITNTSNEVKNIVDFVKENMKVLHDFNEDYGYDYTEKQLIESAQALLYGKRCPGYDANDDVGDGAKTEECYRKSRIKMYIWQPGEKRLLGFGDESHTIIGLVYDYGLRDGGKSESFEYEFHEYWR